MVQAQSACRHVMIYGPPGAGKLSVARALSQQHGLRMLDNHLSVSAALPLFDFGAPEFTELVIGIRELLFRTASTYGVSVVSTFVYAHIVDDGHLHRLVAAAATRGALVDLVQLLPSTEALAQRVNSADRIGTGKITDPAVLARLMSRQDLSTPADGTTLTIDNTAIGVDEVAAIIASSIGL